MDADHSRETIEKKSSSYFTKELVIALLLILPAAAFFGGAMFYKSSNETNWALREQKPQDEEVACNEKRDAVFCEEVQYIDSETESVMTNKTLEDLPECFNTGMGYKPELDFSGEQRFVGRGFDVLYPSDKIEIVESTDSISERERRGPGIAGVATYNVTLKNSKSEDVLASISVRRIGMEQYVAEFMHTGPVFYEAFSNTWWKLRTLDLWHNAGNIEAEQCRPVAVGRTISNNFPIYKYGDGDAGYGYTSYVVVMRETPETYYKGGWTEPVIVTFTIHHTPNTGMGEEDENRLNDIVESMVQTIELYPTSKG